MKNQFDHVDCRYGAPMGRPEITNNFIRPARCFRVRMVDYCYDDGGAYWGGPTDKCPPLYCATNGTGFQWFTRARTRAAAKAAFRARYSEQSLTNQAPLRWVN